MAVTNTIEIRDATREAVPATMIVARVSFSPVPPDSPILILVTEMQVGDDGCGGCVI